MREDVTAPALLSEACEAEARLVEAWQNKRFDEMESRLLSVQEYAAKIHPPAKYAKWRENIEVLVVAISVAMAFRCYFIQPFKIPTGSMQPTLNGIIATPQTEKTWADKFPLNLLTLAFFGERYVEVYAKQSGEFKPAPSPSGDELLFLVGRTPHPIRLDFLPTGAIATEQSMALHVPFGARVKKGDLLASGRIQQGDHLFVNKVKYNFFPPKRGDVIVFDTNYIDHPKVLRNTFYIKRLVGLEKEIITVDDPYLVADGRRITEPYPFKRLVEEPGYNGYVSTALLDQPGYIAVKEKQFLPFGDNTLSSLDGRYFGAIDEQALVGPAFFVYWPFGKHWGFIR